MGRLIIVEIWHGLEITFKAVRSIFQGIRNMVLRHFSFCYLLKSRTPEMQFLLVYSSPNNQKLKYRYICISIHYNLSKSILFSQPRTEWISTENAPEQQWHFRGSPSQRFSTRLHLRITWSALHILMPKPSPRFLL